MKKNVLKMTRERQFVKLKTLVLACNLMVFVPNSHLYAKTHPSIVEGSLLNPIKTVSLQTVQGKIISAKTGETLVGVTVKVKGTNIGAVTDFDGNFTLKNVPEDAILIISYIGYETKEVRTTGSAMLIKLSDAAHSLNEVVVVGYGKQKQATVTGAVGVISGKDLTEAPLSNVTNMLVGRTSGISSVQASGEPGTNAATI